MADFSPDALLTRDAQAGEVAALGCLPSRHQADMRAVARSGGPGIGWGYLRMPLVEEFRTMPHFAEPAGFAAAILKVLS